MNLWAVVFPLRVSKKPGDNKAKKSKQASLKYTAARLHEKGVLIEIEDLQTNQYVLFISFQYLCNVNNRLIYYSHGIIELF